MEIHERLPRLVAVCALSAMVAAAASAQSTSTSQMRTYGRGTVIAGGERFHATDLVFGPDSLSFAVRGSGERKSFALSQVEYATRIKTHAGQGALVGGGLMVLAGVSAVASVAADPTRKLKDNATSIIAGLTAGGALIGAVIGGTQVDEKRVFQNGRLVFDLRLTPRAQDVRSTSRRPELRVGVQF